MATGFPRLPGQDELMQSHQVFLTHCCDHAFFTGLARLFPSAAQVAMPLRLAIACVASVCVRKSENEGEDLFVAGMKLWSVILEVDNREARSLEMLLAVRSSSPSINALFDFSREYSPHSLWDPHCKCSCVETHSPPLQLCDDSMSEPLLSLFFTNEGILCAE